MIPDFNGLEGQQFIKYDVPGETMTQDFENYRFGSLNLAIIF